MTISGRALMAHFGARALLTDEALKNFHPPSMATRELTDRADPEGETMKTRLVQRYWQGQWSRTTLADLKKGDTFRMFEPNGVRVENEDGGYVFLATDDPMPNGEGQLSIACVPHAVQ